MIDLVEYEKSVSVVIPTRNGFGVIVNAVNSIIVSKYYINEVFIVLSNSSLAYSGFLESLALDYAHLLKINIMNARDGNASAARNLGIKASKGKYIALLDDDDIWMPNRLYHLFSHLDFRADCINFTVPYVIGHKDSSMKTAGVGFYKTVPDYLFIQQGLIQTSDILLPTAIALDNLFDDRLPRHQDYDFCLGLYFSEYQFNRLNINSTIWYQYPQTSIVKKGARIKFCLEWLDSKSSQLSREEIKGYLKKEGWYVAYKDKKLFYFLYSVMASYGYEMLVSIIIHMFMEKVRVKNNN
jgi:amylovoran biosynthesis glycosyltransferase AmsB